MQRLLVADDHPVVLSGVRSVLRDTDYKVVLEVGDGAAVLGALEIHQFDILVLDMRMPQRSGLEILQLLRNRNCDIPVVLLTANIEDDHFMEAVQLGVNGIVLKESAQERLVDCLCHVCEGRRWIDQSLIDRALNAKFRGHSHQEKFSSSLSPRERLLVRLVAEGWRNREIADELKVTEGAIKVYLHRLYQRLGLTNRTELAMRAREMGLMANEF